MYTCSSFVGNILQMSKESHDISAATCSSEVADRHTSTRTPSFIPPMYAVISFFRFARTAGERHADGKTWNRGTRGNVTDALTS